MNTAAFWWCWHEACAMTSSLSFAALNGSLYLSLDWTCTPFNGCFRLKFSGHQRLSLKRILPYAGEKITYRPYHILTLNNVYLSEIHMRLYFLDSKMEQFKSVNRQLMHVKSGKIPKNVLIFSIDGVRIEFGGVLWKQTCRAFCVRLSCFQDIIASLLYKFIAKKWTDSKVNKAKQNKTEKKEVNVKATIWQKCMRMIFQRAEKKGARES